jgi:hypothetical protein
MTDRDAALDADALAPLVYHELRRLAAGYMRRERPGQTLQATALVHEAYLRLADAGTPWHDKRHFITAPAIRLVDLTLERIDDRDRNSRAWRSKCARAGRASDARAG